MPEYRLARSYEDAGYKIIDETLRTEGGKLYADVAVKCFKCGGKGVIPYYGYIDNGVCFTCGGRGNIYKGHCRVYTDAERAKLDEQAARRKERELEKKIAEAPAKRKAWLEKYNIEDGEIFVVAGCNTFEIKDGLKEMGAKFYTGIGWFFGKKTLPDRLPNDAAFLFPIAVEDLFYWSEVGNGPYFNTGALDAMKEDITRTIAEINKSKSGSVHVGTKGERLRNMKGTFVSAKYFENEWGGKFIYTFKVGENIFTWFSQSIIDNEIQPEDKILLTGTVKDHTEYNGILQTVLSRCIVKKGE